jgi:chaperonin cofactor prefoldin
MDQVEIEEFVRKETDVVKASIQRLQTALIEGALVKEYQARIQPLDEEGNKLIAEEKVLRAKLDDLRPVTQAKLKLLDDDATRLMAAGKKKESEAKRQQAPELQRSVKEMEARIESITPQWEMIEERKKEMARKLFNQIYPLLPESTHSVISSLCDLLDALWEGILNYQRMTGTGDHRYSLIRQFHREQLVPTDFGQRELSQRVDNWFSPRR